MSKPKTDPRSMQVRYRLSGARMLGVREPQPPTMAIDARPQAGERGRNVYRAALDEECPPVVTEIDDNE